MSVDEEPIVDAAWLRRKAARCLDMARLAINPDVINGLTELALELEAKARAFDQEAGAGTPRD
jgi:hypothetical protein